MTAVWNGYPKNPDEHGLHVIASKLGRNPMVFLWNPDSEVWEGMNSNGFMSVAEAALNTYIGSVNQ